MRSVKEVADSLVLIAYADKQDRKNLLKDLTEEFQSVPYSEMNSAQHKVVLSIFKELNEEILYAEKQEKNIGDSKIESEVLKPQNIEIVEVDSEPQIIESVEPKVVTKQLDIDSSAPIPKSNKVKISKPKSVAKSIEDFSFLDDIDSAF